MNPLHHRHFYLLYFPIVVLHNTIISSYGFLSPVGTVSSLTRSPSNSNHPLNYRKNDVVTRQNIGKMIRTMGWMVKEEKQTDATLTSQFEVFDVSAFWNHLNGVDTDDVLATSDIKLSPTSEKTEVEEGIGIWVARSILLLIAILWGTNFASVKYLETLSVGNPPSIAALARFGVAAGISFPILLVLLNDIPESNTEIEDEYNLKMTKQTEIIKAGIECGFWITLGYFTQAWALETIASGKCAFICSLTVVVVPLLSNILYGKKITPEHLISGAIALLGVSILEGVMDDFLLLGASSTTASSSAFQLSKGDLIALGQPFGFGLAFMKIEEYVEYFEHEMKIPNKVMILSAVQCMTVGFLSLLWVLWDYHGQIPDMSYMVEKHHIFAILWTGVMTTVVAIYMEGVALQTASATEAALIFSSEPVWASIFGAYLLGEKLEMNSYVGGSIILLACVMGALSSSPHSEESIEVESHQNQQKNELGVI